MSAYNFGGIAVLAIKQAPRRGSGEFDANRMKRLSPILIPLALLAALGAFPAAAPARTALDTAHGFAPRQVVVKFVGQRRGRALRLPRGAGVLETARALRRNPRIAYAEPNYLATASAAEPGELELPNDPGTLEGTGEPVAGPGDWAYKQWNFLPSQGIATPRLPISPGGIDVVEAWRNLEAVGRPGGEGVTVAVLDTGIAYRSDPPLFLRSPDFTASQFAKGHDFVEGDRTPLDENGHGTHVAGTIGEKTDNGIGLTGIAYRAKLMPVRVLDRNGRGEATRIAKGIRFAVAHHAQVINMSFNFGCGKKVPVVDEALREAFARGVVAVASAGNLGSETCVSEPATGPRVIAVGGTTEGGCLGNYSLAGTAIDVVAPGGGSPIPGCPSISARPIYQVTLKARSPSTFGIPGNYVGTSMAAAHVTGVAALVLASGVLGSPPTPQARVEAVTRRLRTTARDLGLPRIQEGAGLIDAAAATAPETAKAK
jgi:serine protease